MSDRVSDHAIVTVTLEIDASSTWGTGCAVDQIHRQAGQETLAALCNLLRANKFNRFRVVGQPSVSAIVTKQKP